MIFAPIELTPEHQAVADKARALVLALEAGSMAVEVVNGDGDE